MRVRNLYISLLILVLGFVPIKITAFDINSIDKTKAIWTDHTVSLYHHFFLMEAFRPLNAGICEIENSGYKDWINLNTIGDPITKNMPEDYDPENSSEDIFNIAYKVNIDQRACGINENNYVHMVKAYQANSDEPLYISTYNKNGSLSDLRRELVIAQEKTDANPYGEIIHNYGIFGYASGKGLYQARTKSEIDEENTSVEVESMSLVDYSLLNQNVPAGAIKEMYSAKIIHEIGANGYGTISSFQWGGANITLAQNNLTHGVFPDGIPDIARTTNFAYNDTHLLFAETYTNYPGSPYIQGEKVAKENICLSRTDFWTSIWDGLSYGVYDANGDRLSDNANIQVAYSQEVEGFGLWSGTLTLRGAGLGIPFLCKSLLDGSYVSNDLCGTYGYDYFPLFDVPEGTILTDANGNEYYVRQLKPRKVFAVVDMANCAGLELQPTIATPDHKKFVYLEGEIPPSGAILNNQYANNIIFDPIYGGVVYVANEDFDNDGVLNFLDAFPEDPAKSKDDDYDGIADSEDAEINQAKPLWEKFLDKDLFSNYDH